MSDYNFAKYIRHTSSHEAPNGQQLLIAAGWVEASKKLIVAMTEVCSAGSELIDDLTDPYCWSDELPASCTKLAKALQKLAELDGGSKRTDA